LNRLTVPYRHHLRVISFLLMLLVISCHKDPNQPVLKDTGRLKFIVDHRVNGQTLQENQWIYTNAAGNPYQVSGLKYFISDITLYPKEGPAHVIGDWQDLFYIDEDIPSPKTLRFFDPLPPALYDSVSFIFGIRGEKNISNMYVNPPEVIMAWPEVLGGGYHYLMFDGKWKDTTGIEQPFNLHLGIGQLYHGAGFNTDSIYTFVQNWFRVSLPGSSITVPAGDTATLHIAMNLESWFETPHAYDLNYWGGAIMQNQSAMQIVKENGADVFSVTRNK